MSEQNPKDVHCLALIKVTSCFIVFLFRTAAPIEHCMVPHEPEPNLLQVKTGTATHSKSFRGSEAVKFSVTRRRPTEEAAD